MTILVEDYWGDTTALFFGSVVFFCFLVGKSVNEMPGVEDFGDGPGLGDATLRGKRRLPVNDFPSVSSR